MCAGASKDTRKRKAKKKAPSSTAAVPSESAAGHTYDYFKDKWDKFDVDAALADVDADTEYETDTDEETSKANVRSV